MRLSDTLSRSLKEVELTADGRVSIYSCGPTVYDYPHLGNWYSFLRWDLLVRTLKSAGFQTLWVMNITDVGHLTSDSDDGEDKLAKKAREQRQTAWEIADSYTSYFLNALGRLNFTEIDHLPKASDHIAEQIALVVALEKKGLTYVIDDGVYYDTAQLKDYGKLAKLDTSGLLAGARVEFNPQKRNSTDFALWKLTPPGQQRDMEWNSPWGRGFPGWHLECSAMCQRYLGQPLTIHAGGIDHIPIHHTNELAQSEPVYGAPLAHIWLHSNFITIDGEKMSKSLDNFHTLEDVEAEGYDLQSLRLAVFGARYRNASDFSWALMEAAEKRLKRMQALAARVYQLTGQGGADDCRTLLTQTLQEAKAALQDDLNSPKALEKIDEACQRLAPAELSAELQPELNNFIAHIDSLLGVKLTEISDLSPSQKEIFNRRAAARDSGDFAASDRFRAELLAEGIKVSDTPAGQLWSPA